MASDVAWALLVVTLLILCFLYVHASRSLSLAAREKREGGEQEKFTGWGPELRGDYLTDFSPYGNMSLQDGDMLAQQRVFPNSILTSGGSGDWSLDNSDVVQAALEVPSPVFQPNQLGVTASTFGGLGSFQMAEPGRRVAYQLPQTGLLDTDEIGARLQQHRGSLNKRALDGAVRATADTFAKCFQNELAEAESNDWWSAEAAEDETDFDPAS